VCTLKLVKVNNSKKISSKTKKLFLRNLESGNPKLPRAKKINGACFSKKINTSEAFKNACSDPYQKETTPEPAENATQLCIE
jgi:hypothetical protein